MECCYVCGGFGHLLDLHATKPSGPGHEKTPYFPFLQAHQPPRQASQITKDGVVRACNICYAFLIEQWNNFESLKMPIQRRLYYLKRVDMGPFTGADINAPADVTAHLFGYGPSPVAVNSLNTAAAVVAAAAAQHNAGLLSSSTSYEQRCPSNASSGNSNPIALTTEANKYLQHHQSRGGGGEAASETAAAEMGTNQASTPALPSEHHIRCFVCHTALLKWDAKTAYSAQVLESKEYYPFLEKITPLRGAIPLLNGATKICSSCDAALRQQWKNYELAHTLQEHRVYCIQFGQGGQVTNTSTASNQAINERSVRFFSNSDAVIEQHQRRFIGSGSPSPTNTTTNRVPIASPIASSSPRQCRLCSASLRSGENFRWVSWLPGGTNQMYFPFLATLRLDTQASDSGNGGGGSCENRVHICNTCYADLSNQWEHFERKKTPVHMRNYRLRSGPIGQPPSIGNAIIEDNGVRRNGQSIQRTMSANSSPTSSTRCQLCGDTSADLRRLQSTPAPVSNTPYFPFISSLRSGMDAGSGTAQACSICAANLIGQWYRFELRSTPHETRRYVWQEFMCGRCGRVSRSKTLMRLGNRPQTGKGSLDKQLEAVSACWLFCVECTGTALSGDHCTTSEDLRSRSESRQSRGDEEGFLHQQVTSANSVSASGSSSTSKPPPLAMYNPSPHRATVTVPPLSALPHTTSTSSSSNPSSASQSSNGSNTASSGFAEALRQLARQVVVGNPSGGVDSTPNPPVVTIAPTTRSSLSSSAEAAVSNASNLALTGSNMSGVPGYPGANGIFPWLQSGGGVYPQYTTAHGTPGGRHSTNGPISPSAPPSGGGGSYIDPYMAAMAAYSNGPAAGRPDIAAAVVWQYQRMMMAMYANSGGPGGGSLPNNEAMMLQQSWMQQQAAAAAAAAQQHQQSVVMQQLQQLAAQNQEQWDRLFMLNSLAPGFPGMGHFPPPGAGPNMPGAGGGPGSRGGGNGASHDSAGADRSERGNSTGSAFQPASKKSSGNSTSNSTTPLSLTTRNTNPSNPAVGGGQGSNLLAPAHSTHSPKISHALRLPLKRDHHPEECVIHPEEDRETALDLTTKSSSAKKPKLYRPFEEEALPPLSLPPPVKPHPPASTRLESRGADMDVDEHFRRSLAGLGGRTASQQTVKPQPQPQPPSHPQPPPQVKKSPPQPPLQQMPILQPPSPPKDAPHIRSKIDLELETNGDPLRCERVLKRVRHRARENEALEKVQFLGKVGIVPKSAANVERRASKKHAITRPARALRALVRRHETDLNQIWAKQPKLPSVNNLANNRQGTVAVLPVEKKKESKEMIALRIAINKLRIKSHRKYRKLLRKEKVRYVGRRGIANRVLSEKRKSIEEKTTP